MKKIYTTILALAAVLTPGTVASAQDVPYLINKDHGIGYNKYIVTDPTTGDRTIRIETFATGGGERKAIPADICLVLDNSGSMLCYYAKSGTSSKYKMTMTQSDVDQYVASGGDPLLIPDARYYLAAYSYSYGSTVTTFGGTKDLTSSSYQAFKAESEGLANAFRYAKYNGNYYRVFHRKVDNHPESGAAGPWYFLCFKVGDNYMYLHDKEFVSTAPTEEFYKRDNAVIYTGDTPETVLWRAKTRMEKLLEGVDAFINEIYANNQAIADDLEDGKVGNQIAVVAFGSRDISLEPYVTGSTPTNLSRIVQLFTPTDTDAHVADIKTFQSRMGFIGNTSMGYGMQLANECFRLLRDGHPEMDAYELEDDGTTYKLDAAGHPIPNRSKVVVVFTDGSPTAEDPYTASWGTYYSNTSDAVRARAIDYSNMMKKTEVGSVNAKIFTVGLNASGSNAAFLPHLSSNFPETTLSVTVNGSSRSYTFGPSNPSSSLYYMDAGAQDLKEVFEVIASIAGGKSDVNGTSMVNIDIVSKSFQIPKQAGESVEDKIKVYTAQCLGLDPDKTYVEDGVTKHYLAFAEPVEAGSRTPLAVLWTSQTNEDTGEVTWTRETSVDVDGGIDVTVEDDPTGNNDIIKVTGFDYAKFWCGLDAIETHADNTEQYTAADYGSFDAGTGTYIKGYRGFKIIIDIPICLQENAVGGPKVNTNEPGSGLLDPTTGTLLIPYPAPQLEVPVNLWIQKEGLMKGESATFTIQRKLAQPTDEVPSPQYEFFTTVNVIGDANADGTSKPVMVKLLNLDPIYYYRIVEQGWTWSYSSPAQDESTAPTTETEKSNPIVITNSPKTDTPKHDEAVKRNNM